jgi:hypothetical protein
LPERRIKPRRSNPSPTNLRPQNRRAEWLAFRFCSFYFAAGALWKTLLFTERFMESSVMPPKLCLGEKDSRGSHLGKWPPVNVPHSQ